MGGLGGGWLAPRAKQGGLLAVPTEHPEVQGRGTRLSSRCSVSLLCPTVPKFGILAAGSLVLGCLVKHLHPRSPGGPQHRRLLFTTLLKNPGTNADNKPACLSPITSTLLISFQDHLKSPGCSNTDEMRPESRAYSCAQCTAALPPPSHSTPLYSSVREQGEKTRV